MKTKKCNKCKKEKNINEFYKDSTRCDGYQYYCKICSSVYTKKWYRNNKKYFQKKSREYYNTIKGRYYSYKATSKQRNIKFKLKISDFALLISSPCYYCGNLQDNFNGIDRINSNKSYNIGNCVSCCRMCNIMKNTYIKEGFIKKCKEIVEKQEVMSYRK